MNKNYSLRFILTGLFSLLMLCVGIVIVTLNYTQVKKLLLSASNDIHEGVAEQVILNYRNKYNPVHNSLNILSHSLVSKSRTLSERLNYVAALNAGMNTESSIAAIQLGYGNGDFFILRKLQDESIRDTFDAPDNAFLVVDNSFLDTANRRMLVRIFFDKDLKIILRNKDILTDYDPRKRPWYKMAGVDATAADPYYFFFMHKVGTTVSMKMQNSTTVIAIDIALENISKGLAKSKITKSSEMYLVTSNGAVIASSNLQSELVKNTGDKVEIKTIDEIDSNIVRTAINQFSFKDQNILFKYKGIYWQGVIKKLSTLGNHELYLLAFTPINELLSDAIKTAWTSIYLLFFVFLLVLPIVWYIAKKMSVSMNLLAGDANKIMNFDFSTSISAPSKIQEVNDLMQAQELMKSSLSQFIDLINSLAIEKNFGSLLDKITSETLNASRANAVATYLWDEKNNEIKVDSVKTMGATLDASYWPDLSLLDNDEISQLCTLNDCDYLQQNSIDKPIWKALAETLNQASINVTLLPLRDRQAEFMGLIVLVYAGDDISKVKQQQSLAFVQAFSKFAAVSLESKHLLQMQEDLLDAFIKLIAGAIDAKSPYTGGHCQRVPELAKMIAKSACESSEKQFSDYSLNDDQWKELHIASWLHDCGKVTTPEYVVDKSTKLETIYDRIHEIRTRFEVLKRDAEIIYWKAINSGDDEADCKKSLSDKLTSLDDDFKFVAECNLGGEFMAEEALQRLNLIAEIPWLRTLDNRLGVSWEEARRMQLNASEALPIEESLLANKAEHIIERIEADKIPENNQWGFNLDVPEKKFNRGELYNLSVKAGTLTAEERYIINGHMIQTIKMLDELPFPRHLKNVAEIAGGHHESMDGTGYPKRLKKEDMSLTARMMAIADIFEALTASDRPYKKAKSLSVSLKIMAGMRNRQHIDADLFDLFLRSRVYLQYAETYLDEEQIDEVDIDLYLNASNS